jgi:hypothetical protein
VLRVMSARREVHPEPRGLDDGVIGRATQVSGPAGYLIRAPVLGPAVQGHEPHRGAKVTLLFDALDMEELPEVHGPRLARRRGPSQSNKSGSLSTISSHNGLKENHPAIG